MAKKNHMAQENLLRPSHSLLLDMFTVILPEHVVIHSFLSDQTQFQSDLQNNRLIHPFHSGLQNPRSLRKLASREDATNRWISRVSKLPSGKPSKNLIHLKIRHKHTNDFNSANISASVRTNCGKKDTADTVPATQVVVLDLKIDPLSFQWAGVTIPAGV